jgi:hypothetical protein
LAYEALILVSQSIGTLTHSAIVEPRKVGHVVRWRQHVFVRAFAVSYLYSRDISRHSLNGLTFCHLSVQNYTGFATYAGSTKRPLFLKQWMDDGTRHHEDRFYSYVCLPCDRFGLIGAVRQRVRD